MCGRVHAEFSQEEPIANSSMFAFAGDDSIGSSQLLHDGRVVRRLEVIKHLGRAGGQRALGADIVLDGDRDTGQRGQLLAGGALLVNGFRLLQCCFLGYGNVALNLILYRLRACKNVLCQLYCGDLLLPSSSDSSDAVFS